MKPFKKAAALKRYILKCCTLCTLILTVILTGCGEHDPGTPPEVLLDGTAVVVGETKPRDLTEDGFTTDDLGAMLFELPDRSWVSSIFLKKDDVFYASLVLVNESKEAKNVSDCVIEELNFYSLDDTNKELNISVNGVNPIGMTQEELKEAYPALELDDDTGDFLFHYLRDGDYSVRFEYCYGILTEINITHSFPKSYEER